MPPLDSLGYPITQVIACSTATQNQLQKMELYSIWDLLLHFPMRYEDETYITPLGALSLGAQVLVYGEIVACEEPTTPHRRLTCRLRDSSGYLTLLFFHPTPYQLSRFRKGVYLQCFGEVRMGGHDRFSMIHPRCSLIPTGSPPRLKPYLTPVYPSVSGLSQERLYQMVSLALQWCQQVETRHSESFFLEKDTLFSSSTTSAFYTIHRPTHYDRVDLLTQKLHPAQRRFALEELLAYQWNFQQQHQALLHFAAPKVKKTGERVKSFISALPFRLTKAQKRVVKEIVADLKQKTPMLRLLQGDVGAGKTVVAAIAALHLIENGWQVVMMAPTELLAEQHYRQFQQWLSPWHDSVALLTAKVRGKSRQALLKAIADGEVALVIGTHTLFQEQVHFHHLGLIIIDEQQRFGVDQKLALRQKGASEVFYPHQLMMTATPIPRTLYLFLQGDLATSVLDELPPGRKSIKTVVLPNHRREEVIQRIHVACQEGRQVYWVCPAIRERENSTFQATESIALQLRQQLHGKVIELIHGRMKSQEKDAIMCRFQSGEVDVLVSTTVIEVGVDVPKASLMVIENSERMGLSQLHQLRGRVGRGNIASVCVLLYHPPLSQIAYNRLAMIRETQDGFAIAQKDLELRGPGEVLGTKQTGILNFRVADLARDRDLLPELSVWMEKLRTLPSDQVMRWLNRWLASLNTLNHSSVC